VALLSSGSLAFIYTPVHRSVACGRTFMELGQEVSPTALAWPLRKWSSNKDMSTAVIPRRDTDLMKTVVKTLQHYFNPLHVYCRLRDLGVPKTVAISLCRFYENAVFRFL
jgi:hypothetical protein